MHKYVIYDVWMALKLAFKNFLFLSLIFLVGSFTLITTIKGASNIYGDKYFYFIVGVFSVILIQSVVIYFANRKYIIDLNTNLITFPRSDIENSIFAIIFLIPYWNLMRTMTINANEIENLYLDTKRWSTKYKVSNGTTSDGKSKYKTETQNHILYTLNIAGSFGSAKLQFLSRQKRDEVRNAIQQCVKKSSGRNIDKKVAEFNYNN